jgi:hypothetical protein
MALSLKSAGKVRTILTPGTASLKPGPKTKVPQQKPAIHADSQVSADRPSVHGLTGIELATFRRQQ